MARIDLVNQGCAHVYPTHMWVVLAQEIAKFSFSRLFEMFVFDVCVYRVHIVVFV